MIKTVYFQMLWVSEFIQFLKNVISICKENDPAALNIDTRLSLLEESFNNLEDIFKKEQGSDLTEEIAALDERRDKALISLGLLAKGYANYFEVKISQAAEKILNIIDRYGNRIYKLNYKAETSTLRNLIDDLESDPEMKGAVDTLRLQPLIDELKTANTQFDEKYVTRVIEKAKTPEESTLELRKTAMIAYRDLVNLIDAYVEILGPDRYQKLIKELNELIGTYNETAASRSGDKEAEEEGETEVF